MTDWKRGLPPGGLYHGWPNDWDVSFTVLNGVWHRRRTDADKAAATYRHNADGTVTLITGVAA